MALPRAPQAVIFDLDGLVIDSERLVLEAMRATAPAFSIEIDDAFFHSLIGLPRAANDAQFLTKFGDAFPIDAFNAATSQHLSAERGAVAALKAGVAEILDALDALQLPRALCTSSGRPWVDRHFAAHSLTPRFDAIIARGDYTNGKPHPEPYLTAAARLNAEPAFCLALEDSHNGVRAAHAAGMMTIMVPDMLAPNEEMHAKTVRIAETLHDVAALLSSAPRAAGT